MRCECDGFGALWWNDFTFSPGDIGGQMGLFIGASVLTILEIFDYLYEVTLIYFYLSMKAF